LKLRINKELENFLITHTDGSVTKLAFKKKLVNGYENQFVLQQLYGRQKARKKFPALFENTKIIYPQKKALEQSSSEKTARWKANLVSGNSLADLTGGLGMDAIFFSKRVKSVFYLEKYQELFEITCHNFKQLNLSNIECRHEDALDFLKKNKNRFDWIYLDPDRRDPGGKRRIELAGYSPDILSIRKILVNTTANLLIKVSPMLDLYQAVTQLDFVQQIIVLALYNEVKELLFVYRSAASVQKKGPENRLSIKCVNLQKNGSEITFEAAFPEAPIKVKYEMPQKFIYAPNAAILKAGLFKTVAARFNLLKLHPNTHLYTSQEPVQQFPGKIFELLAVCNYDKKAISPYLPEKKANIHIRNFPQPADRIKKKLALKDGGSIHLFATTLSNDKLKILVCRKFN